MNGYLFLKQVLDFVSMNTARRQFSNQKREGGWYRIAWAFLKVHPFCHYNSSMPLSCLHARSQNYASINLISKAKFN